MTSHAAIEAAAFALFADRGFEETTLEDIAEAVGVGRRTLFRYFPSKYDIPWGQFDQSLESFRATLEAMPSDLPLWQAVHRGVVSFNTFDPGVVDQHRQRMRLILDTPALQAHSALMHQRWRDVVAQFVARRSGTPVNGPLAVTVGRVSLALSLAAYEQWLNSSSARLQDLMDDTMTGLRRYLEIGS